MTLQDRLAKVRAGLVAAIEEIDATYATLGLPVPDAAQAQRKPRTKKPALAPGSSSTADDTAK